MLFARGMCRGGHDRCAAGVCQQAQLSMAAAPGLCTAKHEVRTTSCEASMSFQCTMAKTAFAAVPQFRSGSRGRPAAAVFNKASSISLLPVACLLSFNACTGLLCAVSRVQCMAYAIECGKLCGTGCVRWRGWDFATLGDQASWCAACIAFVQVCQGCH